jgi:uncharacterized NAD-dependent epimerase/dehydratase family protein
MFTSTTPLAIYMEDTFAKPFGKMGYGVLRFASNPVLCIVDSSQAGKRCGEVMPSAPRPDCPIVASVADAAAMGAQALLLGSAPSGGRLPPEWLPALDQAVALGLSIINGLHQRLNDRYPTLAAGQWIWDVRQEPANIGVGKGRARELPNKRMLIVGSDMANGKMTSGLIIAEAARQRGVNTAFLATGQIGMVICGRGVPLDAIRLDYACGAIEQGVMELADADFVIIEGQGSILHPGSTATLPLLRGSCPTHLILNHRADMSTLRDFPWLKVPPLKELAALYESIASACGTLVPAKVVGITLNTSHLNEAQAKDAIARCEDETGLASTDCVRFGADKLLPPLEIL